jgi:hypothetical protein
MASVVVTFFASSQPAFPLLDPADTVTVARIWVSFPNGTLWSAVSNGDGATVTAKFDTSSGIWHGTGYSWTGLPLLGYLVEIDAPDIGVTGTIAFPPVRIRISRQAFLTAETLFLVQGCSWSLSMRSGCARSESRGGPSYRVGERYSRCHLCRESQNRRNETCVRRKRLS